jgi:type IV secretion system protein VirB9
MIRLIAAVVVLCGAAGATAQVVPTPSPETPRVQSIIWTPEQKIVLMALPETAMTVMLEPGEVITRATLNGSSLWQVKVSRETDAFQLTPKAGAEPTSLKVETNRRSYEFAIEAGEGLMAAYLVRLQFGSEPIPTIAAAETQPEAQTEQIEGLNWSYRLRGDRSVRPASIRDNGEKTVITYTPDQPLPAVFAIGATGDEEVVNGYMRGEAFVIDRVHQELVFRIDKEKATARRNAKEDAQP